MLENVVHKLNVVLLAITILSGCLSCVRIDVPQLFFTGGQEYSTKKLCRVFYHRDNEYFQDEFIIIFDKNDTTQ